MTNAERAETLASIAAKIETELNALRNLRDDAEPGEARTSIGQSVLELSDALSGVEASKAFIETLDD